MYDENQQGLNDCGSVQQVVVVIHQKKRKAQQCRTVLQLQVVVVHYTKMGLRLRR